MGRGFHFMPGKDVWAVGDAFSFSDRISEWDSISGQLLAAKKEPSAAGIYSEQTRSPLGSWWRGPPDRDVQAHL